MSGPAQFWTPTQVMTMILACGVSFFLALLVGAGILIAFAPAGCL